MKMTTMLLVVAGSLSLQAVAADTDNTASANNNQSAAYTKAPAKKVQTVYQVLQPKNLIQTKASVDYKIDRVGNISSRPWSQIAGAPAGPSFVDQRVYEPQGINLFWAGNPPN